MNRAHTPPANDGKLTDSILCADWCPPFPTSNHLTLFWCLCTAAWGIMSPACLPVHRFISTWSLRNAFRENRDKLPLRWKWLDFEGQRSRSKVTFIYLESSMIRIWVWTWMWCKLQFHCSVRRCFGRSHQQQHLQQLNGDGKHTLTIQSTA